MDHGLASTIMVYALADRAYDPLLLGQFGIDQALLPPVAEAEEVAGGLTAAGASMTGLAIGTPVTVGTGDDFTNALGAGLAEPGRVVCALGTAEVVGAARQVGTIVRVIEPDDARKAAYDGAYGRYSDLFECLRPLYE